MPRTGGSLTGLMVTVIWPVAVNGRNLRYLTAGAILIALNWLIFIYAVESGQTLQASLGYFINPLLSIALGMMADRYFCSPEE